MSAEKANHQRTVARVVLADGAGLHSGGCNHVAIYPAQPGHGIVFRHIDRSGIATEIPAIWQFAENGRLCTTLSKGTKARIRTVEHLLAACYATGIDNALIEVRGGEIPILDGSAWPWIELIETSGIQTFDTPRRVLRVTKQICVNDGQRQVMLSPSQHLTIKLRVSLRGFGTFHWKGPLDRSTFAKEISAARSFGRLRHGLPAKLMTRFFREPFCQGANFNTVVVLARGRVINPGGLRFPNEFARHRVLDLVGDFMLAGADIIASVTARAPSHSLNRAAVAALVSDATAWEEVAAA